MSSGLQPVPITPQKHDPAWKHCQMFKNGDRVQLKCLYCHKLFKGGGIHRIKEHLAGQKGNASTCHSVPPEVQNIMQESLDGVMMKKRKRQKLDEEMTNVNAMTAEVDAISNHMDMDSSIHLIEVAEPLDTNSALLLTHEEGTSNKVGRKKGSKGKSSSCLDREMIVIPNGGGILDSNRDRNQVHMAIGRFLYDIGASLEAVNSAYFQPMIESIALAGTGIIPPSYHDIRGWILKNSVEEVRGDFDRCKATWGMTGCSVMVDQWCTEAGRTMLNFLVYCPKGTVFLESVDASGIMDSPDLLYELLKKVVEQVGVKHVVQVITRFEENFAIAGRKLSDTYPTLYWTPCAASCVDLILADIGNIEDVNTVIEQARSITRFVYNNSMVLNMVRKCTFGNDIVEPCLTRSATNFATLNRMVDLKRCLQNMVTSQEWMDSPYSKRPGGLEMLDLISSESFWSSCNSIIRLTNPLLRVLRIVGSGKRPAMGYVYAAMYNAKLAIKTELINRDRYMVYWNIIDQRWEHHWRHPLCAAGFYLNPKYFYSIEGDMHGEILSGMFDCIERLVSDTNVQDKIIKEITSYKNASGDFARKTAIRARGTLLPAEWWSTCGEGGCPNLTRLATRILSQTCSSVGFKQNQVFFDKLHDTRNHIEHQRLSDLVFVRSNLQLKQMATNVNEHYPTDPLSFDGLGIVDDWVWKKDLSAEDCGNLEWTVLENPPFSPPMRLPQNDGYDDLVAGFDDLEVFKRQRESEDDNIS
ncbi:hypothetical protein IC582_004440 [Cucumis melo]|uniref:Uncharacterized protein LOC103485517 n=3 Tax=Cucumis melo TaxID=3656 RepID=A0A1S4DTW8_CUCME|nr:uncharacterized protein LOC103485517 [Cucumis melo]XP_008441386.1 uncharacterized protein LOC103485517 [Cucumis melo]XP_016899434.1 uncharacterized protein LOC103485517 [Cucumis melo]ADN34075.1 DNA binding protein [Cucumis melo subsp. melo]KAA0041431.1 putative HAT and BED zinc finger domain-containing protein [Cucumis melo var. makuwa]TYK24305.1 putative HAT and BED zinc finger domain-containing protein [Cucumis melo var. makuwa]